MPQISPDEPATLMFHLPTPRVISPTPRSADSAVLVSGSSAFRPLATSPASPRASSAGAPMVWPPADLDIDDSIREELARMGYVGLTDAQRQPNSPSPAVATPVGATPLSPLLAAWRAVSGILPERLQFPVNTHAATNGHEVKEVAIDIGPDPAAMSAVDLRVAELQSADTAEPVRFKIHPRPSARVRPPPVSSRPTHGRGGLSTVMSIDLPTHEVDELLQVLPSPPSEHLDSAYWQRSPIVVSSSPSLETIERELTAASMAASTHAVAEAALPPQAALPERSSSMPSVAELERVVGGRFAADATAVPPPSTASAVVPSDSSVTRPASLSAGRLSLQRTASVPLVAPRYRRPRSKSHDLSRGADHDLQRLLLSTARKVAQHLRQPIAPPTIDQHAVQRAKHKQQAQATAAQAAKATVSLKRGVSSAVRRPAGAGGVSFATPLSVPAAASASSFAPVPLAHAPRRHSFNAGIFRNAKLDEPHAEPTFKSVFDF